MEQFIYALIWTELPTSNGAWMDIGIPTKLMDVTI